MAPFPREGPLPKGTTSTLLLFALFALVSALLPDERLRLVPRPAEALAALVRPGPAAGEKLVRVRWPEGERAPVSGSALVRTATAFGAVPSEEVFGPDLFVPGNAEAPGRAGDFHDRSGPPAAPVPPLPDLPDDPHVLAAAARARELGARNLPVEDPCLDPACRARALDAFHLALHRARAGSGFARVVHFGDSTISSDLVAGTVRERLQARFGDGGRGYLFVDGPTRYRGQLRRAGRATPGWEIRSLAGPFADDGRYGMGGASFEAGPGERVTFAPHGSETFDLHFLARPGGGRLEVRADGVPVGTVDTSGDRPAVQFSRFRLAPGTRQVELLARGPARVFGAVLERAGAGVVYDTLGVPGSSAGQVLSMDEGDLTRALRRRRPDLLVVMLGMNESHTLADTPAALAEFETRERAMLARLRRAAPSASCLVVSPLDGARRDATGGAAPKAILPRIRDIQHRSATEAGCAFWDLYAAMGGAGSIVRWHEAGLALPDLSHPSDEGGRALGLLLSDALLASHRAWLARAPAGAPRAEPPGSPPGLHHVAGLRGYFAALADVEARLPGAAAPALQLGDEHTAADRFPSQLRRRLAAAFGSGGRGLFFPGRPFRTGAPEDVVAHAAGFRTVEGATGVGPRALGASGLMAAAAFPGDELSLATEDAGPFSRVSAFELHYVVDPFRGGTASLLLDGLPVGTLDTRLPGDAPATALGVSRLEVFPGRHSLSLLPTGDGEVALLGAVLESNRPGATWEALGVAGATAAAPLDWDVSLFHAQVARRHPRLVALAYGTHEALARDFDPDAYRRDFGRLVGLAREVAREASCLVIGPPDALADDGGGRLVPSPHLPWIAGVQREIAAREGCAFWDAREAMGGAGAMERWVEAGFALPDGIHLNEAGYRRLGDLLFEELAAAYRGRGAAGAGEGR